MHEPRVVTVGRRADGAGRARPTPARDVVERLLALLHDARRRVGAELVVFPELALTTFFPRWYFDDQRRARRVLRTRDARAPTRKPLFDEARRLGVGFSPRLRGAAPTQTGGTATTRRSSSSATAASSARTARCTCPGHEEHEPWRPFQHLERRYFEPGPDGFAVWRGVRRHRRHGDLQRPALARDLPRARAAGRRARPASATTRRSTTRPIPSRTALAGLPQPPRDGSPARTRTARGSSASPRAASRKASTRWPRARSSPRRARSSPGADDRRRRGRRRATATSTAATSYKQTLFDFDRYRMPEHYGLIAEPQAVRRTAPMD